MEHDAPPPLTMAGAGVGGRRALEESFAPWRGRVHRRLLLRATLDGLTAGALAGAAFGALGWATHAPALRLAGLGVIVVGGSVGAARGVRRRWSDAQVALYVDGVLGTPETVTSAITLGREAPRDLLRAGVAALEAGPPRPPNAVRRTHALALLGALACIAALVARPTRFVEAAAPTGAEVVKLREVPGLDRVAEVEKLPGRDDAQKDRLAKIAEEARDLKRKLLEGVPRRDALDALHRLRAHLDAERKQLGSGDRKAGLDAAAGALKANGFPGLGEALEDRDLQGFDAMMERIANERETNDRARAREALERAIEEAKKRKADDVARELQKQRERLENRAERGDVLRELSDALRNSPGAAGRERRSFDERGTDDAARDLADALRKGLEKLTPEERKRLAERLGELAERGGGGGKMSPGAKKRLRDLSRKLRTPEGQRQLEEELKDLANGDRDPASDEERRENGLDDAEEGTDDAENGMGPPKRGQPGKGQGKRRGPGGKGENGRDKGENGGPGNPGREKGGDDPGGDEGIGDGLGLSLGGSPGTSPGGGPGDNRGRTKKLDAQSLRARAKGAHGAPGATKPGGSLERTPGTSGETATVRSTGDLGGAPAEEVNSVDRADVPEGVRRQVKTYFE